MAPGGADTGSRPAGVTTDPRILQNPVLLSGIISSAMDAIISVDARQRICIFNAAAERMFRCPASEALGKPLDRFIPPRYREAHRERIREFGDTGVTMRAMEHLRPLSALRADGEEFPIEASISQAEIGGQKVFTVILRDITARQEAEERIRSLNAELERRVEERTLELTEANKELEGFTYSVAHDLRAPLRHLDAFSRILLEDYGTGLPEEARRYLGTIRKSSRIMSRLLEDLLSLARIGRHELRTERVSLSGMAESVVKQMKVENANRTIEWKVQRLPAADCDPGLMKQVFINLLSNAVKYTMPRERAAVEIGSLDQNGRTVVYVRDNGVGFDMKYADKLFGVFQRLHPADEFDGTGVGLATVERIVRRHGGRVWAHSAPNEGATFYFTLSGLPGTRGPAPSPH